MFLSEQRLRKCPPTCRELRRLDQDLFIRQPDLLDQQLFSPIRHRQDRNQNPCLEECPLHCDPPDRSGCAGSDNIRCGNEHLRLCLREAGDIDPEIRISAKFPGSSQHPRDIGNSLRNRMDGSFPPVLRLIFDKNRPYIRYSFITKRRRGSEFNRTANSSRPSRSCGYDRMRANRISSSGNPSARSRFLISSRSISDGVWRGFSFSHQFELNATILIKKDERDGSQSEIA